MRDEKPAVSLEEWQRQKERLLVLRTEFNALREDVKEQKTGDDRLNRRVAAMETRINRNERDIQAAIDRMQNKKDSGLLGGLNEVLKTVFGDAGARSPWFIVTAAVLLFVILAFVAPDALVKIINAINGPSP